MSLSSPRLAWTVVFTPTAPSPLEAPAWPSLITEIAGQFTAPLVDPVTHILHGAIPRAAMARGRTLQDIRYVVGGIGNGITLTLIDALEETIEGSLDLRTMRTRLASLLLGLEVPAADDPGGELNATADRMGALLADRFDEDPAWTFAGLVEVSGVLSEGVPSTLPDGDGWADQGDLRIGRGTGVGARHVAWSLTGHWTTETERLVLDRRVTVLVQGHLNRMSALAQYGSYALLWGEAARSAMRLGSALEGIIADVRLGASWAITGGPLPDGATPEFARLAGRLEVARVRLREEINRLIHGGDKLVPSAERVLGEGTRFREEGPFLEASPRAALLIESLEARESAAARWANALEIAIRAVEQQ